MPTTLSGSTSAADRAFAGTPRGDLLDQLSPREREVLALMAEGRSNRAIGELLTVELKTVETHVSRVFTKLGLNEDRHQNRRVLAALAFLAHRERGLRSRRTGRGTGVRSSPPRGARLRTPSTWRRSPTRSRLAGRTVHR